VGAWKMIGLAGGTVTAVTGIRQDAGGAAIGAEAVPGVPAEKASGLRKLRQLRFGEEALKGDAAPVERRGGSGEIVITIDLGGEDEPIAIVAADQHKLALMSCDLDQHELGDVIDHAQQRALPDKSDEAVQRIGALVCQPRRIAALARNAIVGGAH